MTISFVNFERAYGNSVTSVVPSVPTGIGDGDLLLALMQWEDDPGTITPPAGWTLEASQTLTNDRWYLYSKIANSESGSYTWSWTTAVKAMVVVGVWSGDINTSDPIETISNTQYVTANSTLRASSLTANNTDQSIIFFGGTYVSTTTVSFTAPTNPASFTEDIDTGNSGPDMWHHAAHLNWSSSGATGNIDATMSTSSTLKHAFGILLNPLSTASPVALLHGWGL